MKFQFNQETFCSVVLGAASLFSAACFAQETDLSSFAFRVPEPTEALKKEIAETEKMEADMAMQQAIYDSTPDLDQNNLQSFAKARVGVELFQNAPSVGKQFVLVREDGRIRYAFAVSAGKSGTPRGDYGVTKMRWRHMSASYPSQGENNMDHVTYFKPLYGFHSTTFGVYSLLGTKASHGCVRMGRPQARALFSLIKANGGSASIKSYGTMDPDPRDLKVIRKLLLEDLNFIQDMIDAGNKGDIPFKEEQYYQYLAGDLKKDYVKQLMRAYGIREILEVDEGLGRYPTLGLARDLR